MLRELKTLDGVRERTRERVRRFRDKKSGNGVKRKRNAVKQNVTVGVTRTFDSDSVSDSDSSSIKNGKEEKIEPADLVTAWNEHCAPVGLTKVEFLSPTRKQKASVRIREHPNAEFWEKVFGSIRTSPFLKGQARPAKPDQKPFRATFDWLIDNDTNAVKIHEGKYN